jgi:para-nitrobenzyl esterase
VADEIEAFGGDPSAVTVFGESAGAKSIECLLAMPSARGLFRAAVLQSTYAPGMDAHAAEGFARTVAASAGTADDLTKLRGLPADALLAAVTEIQLRSSPNLWSSGVGPVVDGEVLPEVPISAVGSGAVPPVPVIVGTNLDEFRLFGSMAPGGLDVPEEALVERLTGALTGIPDAPGSEQVATTYREFRSARGQGCSPADILYAVQTDRLFRQHSISLAEAHAQRQPDVWTYLFTWPAAGESGVLGACHALELPFIFGTLDGPTAALTGTDEPARDLSLEMQEMWLGFARSGVPAGETRWPRYEEARRATLEIGRSIRVVDAPEDAERRFWSRGSRPRVPASP